MPILSINALPGPYQTDIPAILTELSQHVATACQVDIQHITATWHHFGAGCYVAAGEVAGQQPPHSHPVMVDVMCFEINEADKIALILRETGQFLEKRLNLPDNIFVTYRLARSGQVYSQGQILR